MKQCLGLKGKIISMIITISMVMNISLPVYAAEITASKEINSIVSVVVKDSNGKVINSNNTYPLQQGSSVTLNYEWKIPNGVDAKSGDYTIVQVPKAFSIFNPVQGNLVVNGTSTAGTFSLNMNGQLKLVFNNYVETHENISGTVSFKSEFNTKVIKGENPVKIVFPISDSKSVGLTIKFKPENVSGPIDKKGTPNQSINPTSINWQVDVNKELNMINNGVISDTLGDGLTLNKSSIKVYSLNVALNGTTTLGSLIPSSKYSLTTTSNGFKINLGDIDGAYRVVYSTNISDQTKAQYSNTAAFQGKSETSTVSVKRGDDIDKTGQINKPFNGDEIDWSIKVNKSLKSVSNATIKDNIPEGLKLEKSSIKVYKLTIGSNGQVTGKTLVPSNKYSISYVGGKKPTSFTISLGNIQGAYGVEYETDIKDDTKQSFTNTAYFGSKSASATVKVKRGTTIVKSGTPVVQYDSKYINWTIDVNTAEEDIPNAVVYDDMGAGLSLVNNSIKVYKLDFDKNGNIKGETLVPSSKYKISISGTTPPSFKVSLGDIDSAYRIQYKTNIDDLDKNGGKGFTNTARLSNKGSSTTNVNPYLDNVLLKAVEGDINYQTKTMGWRIYVNPLKGPMNSLVINDVFPSGGLTLIQNSVVVSKFTQPLVEGKDYTLSLEKPGDLSSGFKITFLETVSDAIYTIDYKTKFDPYTHGSGTPKTEYVNKATFTYSGEDTPVVKEASQKITPIASTNGQKTGSLSSNNESITYGIYANYLGEENSSIVVKDVMQGNQELVSNSIEVYDYEVASNGSITIGSKVDSSNYTISDVTSKSFTLTIKGPTNKSYYITYKANRVGLSQSSYTNKAVVNNDTYNVTISYKNYDNFVGKKGVQSGGYINWSVDVNSSLSEVENAVLVDTLGAGQSVVPNSFKVYRASDHQPYNNFKVVIGKVDPSTGSQTFMLQFLDAIDTEYIVDYQSKITTTVDKSNLTNTAYFKGDGITTENKPFHTVVQVRVTSGEGTGEGTTPPEPGGGTKPEPGEGTTPPEPGGGTKPEPGGGGTPPEPGEGTTPPEPGGGTKPE
ncbi:MAG: collagen binding domain-containing protein, partial [Clostridium sp.]